MSMLNRTMIGGMVVAAAFFILATVVTTEGPTSSATALAQPPEGQTYIGTKKCAACHFKQYMVFRKTKHAKSFDILPDKYKADTNCLECHTTGHGEPSGYKDASTPELAGTSCEACHGPGSKHGEIALGFGKKKLTEEEETIVRGSIYKIRQDNACVKCHATKAHKEHPKYDKD